MMNRMDPKIEELLNGFVDGELTADEETQVRRLVAGNELIARRLKEIGRCRLLVNSLPPAEPPAEVISGLREILRSHSTIRDLHTERRRGARHLFVRQVLAASLIVGLLGLFAAVIFKITGPTESNRPVAVVQPKTNVTPQVSPATAEKVVADTIGETGVGVYSLKLQTGDFTGVDAYIKKLLDESTWLKYESEKEGPGRSTYRVLCSKGALEALMSDLATVWSKFDSATLVVHTADVGRYVAVEGIRPEQVADIARQVTMDQRIRVAKDFAALNSAEQEMADHKVLAIENKTFPELIAIPKPVLTSGEKNSVVAPKGANDQVRVDLSIVVTGHK